MTYILDHSWTQERRRLDLLEALRDGTSIRRLQRTGVGPGKRCLEVGAGRGSIARWLGRVVGPTGSVLALDLETDLLDDLDEPNVAVRAGDVLDISLEPGSFDLIHTRAVLTHINERSAAVARMASWLAPGGWLVLEELDSLFDIKMDRAWTATMSAFEQATATMDWHCGRELVPELVAAGLEAVGADVDVDITTAGSASAEWTRLTMEAMRPAVLAAATLTDDEVDSAIARLDDPSFGVLGLLWVGAWGQAPVRAVGA